MIAVESSNVAAVDFNPQAGVIRVEFKSGGIYDYLDCDQDLFDQFLNADSKGKFLNENIKKFKAFVRIKAGRRKKDGQRKGSRKSSRSSLQSRGGE